MIIEKKQFTKYILITGLLSGIFINAANLFATDTYRAFLRDKGPGEMSPGTELYETTKALHNQRCIDRRLKVMSEDNLFSIEDAPLFGEYIEGLENAGAEILLKIRWMNYTVIRCDSLTAIEIGKLDYVRGVQITSTKFKPMEISKSYIKPRDGALNEDIYINCGDYDYGSSYMQAEALNIPMIHRMGITGRGTLIGVLDNGFDYERHECFSNIDVIGEFDFVHGDSITKNEEIDPNDQDYHGTLVLSTMAGFDNENMIGIAPNASFLLGKTEDMRSETIIEEDYYAAGVEWLESKGADIITSSLGYVDFDSTDVNFDFEDLDGATTAASRMINKAVARGVVCVSSAGNDGPKAKTLNSPADADSVIAVGALKETPDSIANFSSRGPNAKGAIKPNVAAPGEQVFCVKNGSSAEYQRANGTSLAAPLIAGSIGLIISSYPELRPWELRENLYKSATQYENPDNIMGYGKPDILNAMTNNGILLSPHGSFTMRDYQRVIVHAVSSDYIKEVKLFIRFNGDVSFEEFAMYPTAMNYQYAADIPLYRFGGRNAAAYIMATDYFSERRLPYHEDSIITIIPNEKAIPCGVPEANLPIVTESAPNAYVAPSLVENGKRFIELNVHLEKASDIKYKIFAANGGMYYSNSTGIREQGISNIYVPVSELAQGAYFLQVEYGGRTEVLPFMVVK